MINTIHEGDCASLLNQLDESSIDLTINRVNSISFSPLSKYLNR